MFKNLQFHIPSNPYNPVEPKFNSSQQVQQPFVSFRIQELETPVQRKYGLKISRIPKENHVPLKLGATLPQAKLPSVIDLRPKLPPCYDQGTLGSCTANALCAAFQYDDPIFMGSRLFVYYNERKVEGTINQDAGAELHDGIDTLKKYGVCPEIEWPYDVKKFAVQPPNKCYISALQHHVYSAANIKNDMNSMKNCLNSGFPFVVGILLYQTFESRQVAKTGKVPMPRPNEPELGGHAVLVCGYNDNTQSWIVRNSWGTKWGDKGYFYLPYAYLLDSSLCSDLWNITRVQMTIVPKK